MSVLTLELNNDADLDLFISFAKRLNAGILDITQSKTIEKKITEPVTKQSKRYFGCGKHIIKSISDDFTSPLPEFKEYMP